MLGADGAWRFGGDRREGLPDENGVGKADNVPSSTGCVIKQWAATTLASLDRAEKQSPRIHDGSAAEARAPDRAGQT